CGEDQGATGEVSLHAVLLLGRTPQCQDRLRVELQPEGGAGDAQGAPHFRRELIAIKYGASCGSRGFTHACALGVSDHAKRYDFGGRWASNQQGRRCNRRKLATKNRMGLTGDGFLECRFSTTHRLV